MATSTSTSTLSTPVSRRSMRADERRIGTVIWRRIDVPSTRRNHDLSGVWIHGDRYCNIARPDPPRFICNYCNAVIRPQSNGSTGNYRRHLKRKHQIILAREEIEEEGMEEEESDSPESIPANAVCLCSTVHCLTSTNIIWFPHHRV